MIELIITIAIVSILLLTTIPNMNFFIINNHSITTTNTIVSALQFARSEAINRKIKVKYCKSLNHNTCGGKWENGQIVIDENGKLLRAFAALKPNDSLTWNSSLGKDDFVEFTSNGSTNGQVGTFTYIPKEKIKYSKKIIINQSGRIRTLAYTQLK